MVQIGNLHGGCVAFGACRGISDVVADVRVIRARVAVFVSVMEVNIVTEPLVEALR